MIVCKFGGTSVASAEQIKKVASIVKSNPERKIVAVSAPGKRSSDDIKVTDLLIDLANTVINKGDVEAKIKAVVNRYSNIAEDLGLDNTISDIIEQDIRGRVTENWSDKDLFLDNIKASGEDNNAKLIACYFNAIGMPAKYVSPKDKLILNDFPERTYALPEAYENLSVLKNTEEIIIFLDSSVIQRQAFYAHLTVADLILQVPFWHLPSGQNYMKTLRMSTVCSRQIQKS